MTDWLCPECSATFPNKTQFRYHINNFNHAKALKEEARAEGFFPEKASYKARYFDMAEKLLLKPASAAVDKALKMFSWIQSGSMQLYIIYGLIFLLLSIAWVLGGRK